MSRYGFVGGFILGAVVSFGAWMLVEIGGVLNISQQASIISSQYDTSNGHSKIIEVPVAIPYKPDEHTILLAGDIMLDRSVEKMVNEVGEGDWAYPFKRISEFTSQADITFANLEGPLSDQGANQGSIYSFRFEPESIAGLLSAGIDVVSLANNHILDYGSLALCDSVERLQQAGIGTVGAGCSYEEANIPYIVELGNMRIAFLAYTNLYPSSRFAEDEMPGLSHADTEIILQNVRFLKEKQLVDYVFVSYHWGDEYKTRSNKRQQDLAHKLVDGGVDVVIGHHPHVVQEMERYGDGWIIYSLGNFVFDQYFSDETMRGSFAEVTFVDGVLQNITPHDFKISETYQPYFE